MICKNCKFFIPTEDAVNGVCTANEAWAPTRADGECRSRLRSEPYYCKDCVEYGEPGCFTSRPYDPVQDFPGSLCSGFQPADDFRTILGILVRWTDQGMPTEKWLGELAAEAKDFVEKFNQTED